jgi:integrase
MSLYKRGGTWWTDFSVNGQRFRLSLDTSDWREAQRQEKERISQASAGKLTTSGQQFARLAFSEGADRYLEGRKLELSKQSLKKEKQLLKRPRTFFAATRLNRINAESLLAYRESRARDGRKPSYLNMELGVIRRVLKRAKRWHMIADDVRPLKEARSVGKALAYEDKAMLLRIAASRPDWQVARCAAVVALNTTMRGCELRGLRWRDVNLLEHLLTIHRSKTEAGERVIPLNADAMAVISELYERAEVSNCAELDHFVFPACENGNIDPKRPQASWRTAWRHLTRAIICPGCERIQNPSPLCCNEKCKADMKDIRSPLEGLRFHDLRHHAITELAESQASDQTIMAIAGHVSQKMLAHYSHIRLEAKRTVLDALAANGLEAKRQAIRSRRYVTRNVTNRTNTVTAKSQAVEKNGRPVETRTPDLYRVKVAL